MRSLCHIGGMVQKICPWSQNQHVYVAGAPAHSLFKKTQLLNRLMSLSSVQSIESQWIYLFDQALNEQQHQRYYNY